MTVPERLWLDVQSREMFLPGEEQHGIEGLVEYRRAALEPQDAPAVAGVEIPAGYTPGPWRWEVNRKGQIVQICGGAPAGHFDKTVLSFSRWGMGNAAPVFWFWQDGKNWSEKPQRADALAVPFPGRQHHADWLADIDHPDARLIALAPAMAEELVALRAEVAQWRNAGLHLADEYPVSAFGLPGNDDVRGYGWIKVIAEMAGVKSRKEVRAALTPAAKS